MPEKDGKLQERKEFQDNINDFGKDLEERKTLEDVKQLLVGNDHMNEIISEINKKRGMFSDSKKPLQKFGQVFSKDSFESITYDNLEQKFNELNKACNELQKAGSNKKVSEKAIIKNINMQQLINGISRCSNNIMMNIEKNTQNLLKFSAELNDLFTSKETKIEDIIKILESFKKNFELLENEKLVKLIDNAITCLKGDNEKNVFQSFRNLNDSMDKKYGFIENFNNWFGTNIFKGNSESPTETFDDMKLNTNKTKQEFRKSVSLVSKVLNDGDMSTNDNKLIDFQVLKILSTVKKSIEKDTPKELDKLEMKLNKCKNPGEKANIVIKIVKLLLKDKNFKPLALKKDTPENSAISSLRRIISQLINVSKGLKGTGEMTNENQKIYEDTIDGVSDLFKESLKDGVLTAEEINTIKENVKKIIDESPVDGKNMGDINKIKEDIKSELDKELSSVTDEIKVYEVVDSILDKVVKKTGEKNQKIVQSNINELKKKISELKKQAPSGPASQGTTNQGTAGEKAIENLIKEFDNTKYFDSVKDKKTFSEAFIELKKCTKNIWELLKSIETKSLSATLKTYIQKHKEIFEKVPTDENEFTYLYKSIDDLTSITLNNENYDNLFKDKIQKCRQSYYSALGRIRELKSSEQLSIDEVKKFINNFNKLNFFEIFKETNIKLLKDTFNEIDETKITNVWEDLGEFVDASKFVLSNASNLSDLRQIAYTKLGKPSYTIDENLSTAVNNICDEIKNSYITALQRLERSKELNGIGNATKNPEKIQKEKLNKKLKILNELKNLWVVKHSSKKDEKTPSAFEIYAANDNDKRLDSMAINLMANFTGNGYVLVDGENVIQHAESYPYSKKSINSNNRAATAEVKKFLKKVVEHGKWPASQQEAKEWVK